MLASRLFLGATSIIAVYHLCVVAQLPTWFGFFMPHQMHKAISVFCALALIFVLVPLRSANKGEGVKPENLGRRVPWYDWALIASAATSAGFVVFFHETVLDYGLYGFMDRRGIFMTVLLVLPLLEAVRRTTGWVLPIIILSFVAIAKFQQFLPGLLHGQGFDLERLLFSMYVGNAGIFGLPLGIAANIVIVYLIFGALMHRAGASQWFMDMALSLTGWSRGGPAKAAVVASAMFGSISGSPSGNSATTGVFTIPMMKSIGYKASFAAAVEAVASTGGMILPPVMGAIAFLMAEWIEVSYVTVVIAATLPACLYFLIVFISVHLQAQKDGVEALPRDDLPKLKPTLLRGWHHLLPIMGIVYFLLIASYPPDVAGAYGSAVVIAASFLSRDRSDWLFPRRILSAFEDGVIRWVIIAAITGSVGIMIGALELSGVGIKISRFIVELAGGNLILTMLFVGIVSLIVGMGLDATPAYITLATLMAPALVVLGVPDIAAHLFVIYWGLASFFTPPTCIAVFVTCSIAGANIWSAGWEAVKLGIAAFLIPFAFVLNPALLLRGALSDIAIAVVAAGLGAALIAAATRGFAFGLLNAVQRLCLLIAAVLLIAPGGYYPLAGTGLGVLVLLPQLRGHYRAGQER